MASAEPNRPRTDDPAAVADLLGSAALPRPWWRRRSVWIGAALLLAAGAGQYLFRGVHVERFDRDQRARLRRQYLGFVFQGFNLLARTSVQENVELQLLYRGEPAAARQKAAREALAAVGLTGWEHHTPAELSGGQQQRVAIARAIVSQPTVLLADEPTGNLDTARSREIMELLTGLNRERGITVLMVTHEPDMAEYARRIIRFVDGRMDSDVRQTAHAEVPR